MEQKVIPIILNGKDSAERMKEITDRLETGIQQLFDSDRYKAYLTTMAKFHNYSFNNTLLISMQGGQLVAGFNKWKDTFHRTVKKGEKGIKILVPAPYKVKQKMEAQNLELTSEVREMPDTLTPYDRLAQNEQIQLVHRLVNELPERQRTIMQLRDVEGKSYKEIADILQITEEQVKVTLFRARQKIKQRYTEIEDYGL